MIEQLIDKQDTFEIVRDQIAQILANEIASQQALAVSAGKDPSGWALHVYTERSNPWEQALDPENEDFTPIANVWYDSSDYDKSKGNIIERQQAAGTFNIDCVGFGVSSSDGAGHVAGDELAARALQRAIMLVRNIVMAAAYRYLDLRGLVSMRWITGQSSFQPAGTESSVVELVGGRIVLEVQFNEFSPQVVPETLDGVNIEVQRASDGRVLADAEYDYS